MKVDIRSIISADVGVSLSCLQLASHHIITPELFLCDILLSHATYGRDRLNDHQTNLIQCAAPAGRAAADDNNSTLASIRLYKYSTTASMLLCTHFLHEFGCSELIPVLTTISLYYSQGKKYLFGFKPIVIGFVWAYTIVYLPVDNVENANSLFFYYAFLFSAASNYADIKDVDDDKKNGVRTIPVMYGNKFAYVVSGVLSSLSLMMHNYVDFWTFGDVFSDIVCIALLSASSFNVFNVDEETSF